MQKKVVKARLWCFLVYPTKEQLDRLGSDYDGSNGYPDPTLPDDWEELLTQTFLPWGHSPVHDRDLFSDSDQAKNSDHKSGTRKRPHYHCMIAWEGPVTYDLALQTVQDAIGADNVSIVKKCNSALGYYRYFTHADNVDKVAYQKSDIRLYNGLVINDADMKLSIDDKLTNLKEMVEFINDNEIKEFCDFVQACQQLHNDTWFYLATCVSSIFIKSYIQSFREKCKLQSESKKLRELADNVDSEV